MVTDIADIIKECIEDLPFVDVIAGMVKTLEVSTEGDNGRTIIKRLPVALNATHDECDQSTYQTLVPDFSKKSIIYFEDRGSSFLERRSDIQFFESRLRLVCWLNVNKLGYNTLISPQIIKEILKVIPLNIFNHPPSYQRISIRVENEETKDSNIFSRYTYDEKVSQYLMFPADYFALNLKVNYAVNLFCGNDFQLNEPIEC